MIPLHKLAQLPRSYQLRKAANLLRGAERRLMLVEILPPGEMAYLSELMRLLAGNGGFSPAASESLEQAAAVFSDGAGEQCAIRRSLNTVYQILLSETGRYQADWDFYQAQGCLDPMKRRVFPGMQVYLEDIRSPHNVGAMFRAAESFGTEKIWVSPLCADPRHKRALRTAMGCIEVLPWERLPGDPFAVQDSTCAAGDESGIAAFCAGPFFALETGGIPLADFPFPQRAVLIAGSEELGLSPRALAAADASLGRVSIPVYGAKGSLNVSVAFGIVMQAWAAKQVTNNK